MAYSNINIDEILFPLIPQILLACTANNVYFTNKFDKMIVYWYSPVEGVKAKTNAYNSDH